jgi:hypothetical protein
MLSAPPGWRNPNAVYAESGTTTPTPFSMNRSRDDLVLLLIPFTEARVYMFPSGCRLTG